MQMTNGFGVRLLITFIFFLNINGGMGKVFGNECRERLLSAQEEKKVLVNLTLGLHVIVDGNKVLTEKEQDDSQDPVTKLEIIKRRLCGGGGGGGTVSCKTCTGGRYRSACQTCSACLTCTGYLEVNTACTSTRNTVCQAKTYTCSCSGGSGKQGSFSGCTGCSSCDSSHYLSGSSCV